MRTNYTQSIVDKLAQNLKILSKNFRCHTRPPQILMGFINMGWLRLVGSFKL